MQSASGCAAGTRIHPEARCRKQMTFPFKLIRTVVFAGVKEVRFYDETLDHVKKNILKFRSSCRAFMKR
jgi:hypothetical protein